MKSLNAFVALSFLPALVFAANSEPVQQYHQGNYEQAKSGLEKQAQKRDKDSSFFLGKMYMLGFGVEKNQNKGLELITKSANLKNVDAQMYLAKYYLNKKDNIKEALVWFRKAADLENVEAQMFCAASYWNGVGVKRNRDKAKAYIIDAAQNGNADAQYQLAKIFLKSRHKKDRALGLIWLEKAADKKSINAQYLLGSKMFYGKGVKKDRRQAVKLLKAAATGGNKYAGQVLGEYYLSLPRTHRNFKESLYWYEKSAEAGNVDAQNRLGELYLTNWEDFSNPKKAVHWLSLAANQGQRSAQLQLAKMFAEGDVVPKNETKAFEWRLKLAREDDANAQRQVGMMYYYGQGVKENKQKAIEWLTKAANNNDYIAKFKLESVKKSWNSKKKDQQALIPTPKTISLKKVELFQPEFKMINPNTIPVEDFIKVLGKLQYQQNLPKFTIPKTEMGFADSEVKIQEIQRLALHGYAKALYQLGVMYETGHGVEKKDVAKAVDLFKQSVAQKYLKAEYALGVLYLQGKGVPQSSKKALYWLKKAALKGSRDAQFVLGEIYELGYGDPGDKNHIEKDYQAAKTMYGLAANADMPQAQYNLAQLYVSGKLDQSHHRKEQKKYHQLAFQLYQQAAKAGIEKAKLALAFYYIANSNAEKNLKWSLSIAQNNNSPQGKFLLGLMYSRGIATDKNEKKAVEFFKDADSHGNPIAEYILGSYYGLGIGVSQDSLQARVYLDNASRANIPFADYNLAVLDYHDGSIDYFLYLLQKASEKHYQPASILLADFILNHHTNETKLREAATILKDLAKKGNPQAQIKLAYMYQNGIYFDKNYEKAFHWNKLAAQQKNPVAEYALGKMYQIGQGTERNLQTAEFWYKRSVKANFMPAAVALGFINETDFKNYQQAEYWYKIAADKQNPVAIYNLALLYEYGKGVPVNEKKAQALFKKADVTKQALNTTE